MDSQFALLFSFQRRAMALGMADIMSFENHELLRARFVSSLMKAPCSGFQPFTLEQVLEADVQFWLLMAEETRDGIRRHGASARPCDVAFKTVIGHPEFAIAMTPRQLGSTPRAAASASSGSLSVAPSVSKSQLKKQKVLANKVKAAFDSPAQSAPKGGSGKGGSKGQKAAAVKLPAGLHGMIPRSSAATGSKRMCYSFNLGQCQAASPGQDCARGAHMCMKPSANGEACSKPHGSHACTGA